MQHGGAMQGLSLAEPNILWLAILAFHLKNLVAKRTIQVYNLFQDLFNWFIILEGGYRVQSCFGTKALPTDKKIGLAAVPDAYRQSLGLRTSSVTSNVSTGLCLDSLLGRIWLGLVLNFYTHEG